MTSQAAQTRLNVASVSLRQQLRGENFTLHGFRSGAEVSMALAGVDLHAIMDHVRWKRSETASHYIKLKQVINPAGAAARLADLPSDAGKDYECFDALRGFFRAF